jgi:(5-formylfuran-3-yl)methyl phosphate synthase
VIRVLGWPAEVEEMPVARQRLLVSVRGPNDARAAVAGGAHIIDAEYPKSALGTVHPGNIHRIRSVTPKRLAVSTNIGEVQNVWSTAAQAALGVALAGADIIKIGLADLPPSGATRLMADIARQMRFFFWKPRKQLIATFFADKNLRKVCDPVRCGADVASKAKVAGVLIDTFEKRPGHALLDLTDLAEITDFVRSCHAAGVEAWIAGSIKRPQLSDLWATDVDVVCVRGAACEGGEGRLGGVSRRRVEELVVTIPTSRSGLGRSP